MILSTVVDESRVGHIKTKFVDDPRMVNVAVSRAKKRFILVVNQGEVPRSKNIRALVDYIRYQSPDQVIDSGIVSVFDLLYREYSEKLRAFADRVESRTRFKSENVAWTAITEILTEEPYGLLCVAAQVRLRDLLPSMDRLDGIQQKFVKTQASVDFAIYHSVTKRLILAVEVDGFSFHLNSPDQLVRDAKKDSIVGAYGIPLLRLPTQGSGEHKKIRAALDQAMTNPTALKEMTHLPALKENSS